MNRNPTRSPSRLAILVALLFFMLHCDRAIEPFDPNEEPREPDLSKIFPPGSGEPSDSVGAPGMAGSGPAPRGTMPGSPAPRGTMPGSPAPAGDEAPGPPIRGRVEIAEPLRDSVPEQAILFLIARRQDTGPPLAVLRIPNPSFPYEFELGQANVMIPTLRFEGDLQLTARLDSDGNARTKLPGDLVGKISGSLSPGDTGIVLTLDAQL